MKRIAVIGLPFFAERTAAGLRDAGFDAHFYPRPGRSPRAALELAWGLLRARLVYCVGSSAARNSPADVLIRLRKRVLMHWVGSDVLAAQKSANAGQLSERLVRRAKHFADAPWLSDELRALGIATAEHPLPVSIAIGEPAPLPTEFRVAVYLPATNLAAYDVSGTLEVFRALPDVSFGVFGGYQLVEPLPNVESAGFVRDMPALYHNVTALLRLVHHDGLSHSVVEALSFARYAVWTYSFAGAGAAKDAEAAVTAITELKRRFDAGALEPNLQGATAVTQRYAWYTLRDEFREALAPLLS